MSPPDGARAESGKPSRPGLRLGPMDEGEMTGFARQLASALHPPIKMYFDGELGAGKTTFIRALIQALGYEGSVKSPSYGLMEVYELDQLRAVHLDLYRIADPEELEYLGLTDQLGASTVLLVEWPQQGGAMLPEADLRLVLSAAENGDMRTVHLYPQSNSGIDLCFTLESSL